MVWIWKAPWPDGKDLFLKIPFSRNSKVPYKILTFFLSKLYKKFFSLYSFITLLIFHAKFGLIWTIPSPDEKESFFSNSQKFAIREIRKIPYEDPIFFLDKLYQKFFLLFTFITLVILHTDFGLIWKAPWPDEKDIFKVPFSRKSKVPYEILTFLLGMLYKKFFLFYSFNTLVIFHTKFGLIWTTPSPDEKESFLNFAKIRNSRNSQNSVWRPNFFPGQIIPNFFLLFTFNTLVILHTDFGLIWKAPWPDEKDIFKVPFSRKSKVPYEILTYLLGMLYKKFFLFYSFNTLVIFHTKFGLIWTTPAPDEKELFLNFAEIRNSRISQNSVWNNLFPGQAIPKFFLLFSFITLVIFHTKFGLIWTTPAPDEKELFLNFAKIRNSRISQNSVWRPNFFPGQIIPKFFFCFSFSLHWWYSIPILVWFEKLLDPMKKTFLKFLFRENQKFRMKF